MRSLLGKWLGKKSPDSSKKQGTQKSNQSGRSHSRDRSREFAYAIQHLLGAKPGNLELYKLAFTHRSSSARGISGFRPSNERLEYLGDAVLGMVIAELVFKKYPFRDEGFLTQTRSKIVSRKSLGELARRLGLDRLLIFDYRSMPHLKRDQSMYGDAFEAFIGAIFLDKGFKFTHNYILEKIVRAHLDVEHLAQTEDNFKSVLLEWCQQEGHKAYFDLVETTGHGHRKMYKMVAVVNGEPQGEGLDFGKKGAEQAAAKAACEALGLILT